MKYHLVRLILRFCSLLITLSLAMTPALILAQESFKDPKTALASGKKKLELGQFQEAYEIFQQGYTQFKDPEFVFFSADALLKLQKYQESKDAFESYLQLQPKSKHKDEIDVLVRELNNILSTKVTIKSTPNSAAFWIDDQFGPPKGTTPATISISAGSHTAILQKTGSGLTRYNFEVAQGQSSTIDVKLEEEPVLLQIVSDPKGAEVFLDGSSIGFTPFQGEIPAGKHSLVLKKQGYGNANLSINERPGKTLTLSQKMPPPPAILLFSNIEANETITIDKKTEKLKDRVEMPPGEYTYTLEAPGFRARTDRVQLSSGKETLISAKLQPMGISLFVTNNTPGATLLVNGKAIGQTPMSSNVFIPFGERPIIRVEKEGFKPYEKKLSDKDGDFELSVDFQKKGHPPLGPLAALTTAVALGATGGAFGVIALKEDDALQANPTPSQAQLDSLRLKSNLSNVGLGAGAAALIGSMVWLHRAGGLTRSPGKLKQVQALPTPNGAVAQLSF